MHLHADQLSRLFEQLGTSPIDDGFVNENLFVVTSHPEWYAGILEFLTTQQLPVYWLREQRRKVRVNSRYFIIVGHRLFRRRTDGLPCRCVVVMEVPTILEVCHDSACGGHFLGQLIGQKILGARYFWPTLFRHSHIHVKRFDVCRRYAINDLRMKLPLHVSLPLIPFEKWGIDYVWMVHYKLSKCMTYKFLKMTSFRFLIVRLVILLSTFRPSF